MSVYDLYQSYLNQQQESPVMVSPVDPNYLLYLQQQQSGGGEGITGGGAFGNLDLSKGKEVTKNVYQEIGPGLYDFAPETMMAYPNLSSGLYQTYEGKNVDPMFSNTGATFGLAGMAMKMMGLTPKAIQGFIPNSIQGTFNTPADFLRYISGVDRREAQAAQEATQQKALEDAAAAKRNFQQYTSGGGGENRSTPSAPSKSYEGSTGRAAAAFRM